MSDGIIRALSRANGFVLRLFSLIETVIPPRALSSNKPAMAFKAVIRDSNHGISSMDNHPEDDDSAFIKFAESIPLDTVVFSASDLQLLELYDELQELRLEHALLDAQNTVAIGHHYCTFVGSTP